MPDSVQRKILMPDSVQRKILMPDNVHAAKYFDAG
jgi:hypothetical protein